MTSIERKEKRRALVRQEVLDAAKSVLKQHGADCLTIRKVAEVLGYSPAALYEYFKSKDEMIIALCQQVRQTCLKQLRRLDATMPAVDYLKAICHEQLRVRLVPENDIILSLRLSEHLSEIPQDVVEVRDIFHDALKALKLPGLLDSGQREKVIFMLRAFLEGVVAISVKKQVRKGSNLKELVDDFIELMLKAWR